MRIPLKKKMWVTFEAPWLRGVPPLQPSSSHCSEQEDLDLLEKERAYLQPIDLISNDTSVIGKQGVNEWTVRSNRRGQYPHVKAQSPKPEEKSRGYRQLCIQETCLFRYSRVRFTKVNSQGKIIASKKNSTRSFGDEVKTCTHPCNQT